MGLICIHSLDESYYNIDNLYNNNEYLIADLFTS